MPVLEAGETSYEAHLEAGLAEMSVLEAGERASAQHGAVGGQAGVAASQHCSAERGFPTSALKVFLLSQH